MADAEFEFENAQWQSFLKKLNTRWNDIKKRDKFAAVISSVVFGDIIDHFSKESGPSGRWKPRSPWYKVWIEKQGYTKILQVSGTLRQSLTPAKGKYNTNPIGVLFYSDVPYAAKHQHGEGKIPARPFMWLSKMGMSRLVKVSEAYLNDKGV